MTSPTSRKKRLIIFLIFSILFLILIPIVTLYSLGYRLENGLTLKPTGGVYVYYPESGVDVTVKGYPPEKTSIFTKSVLVQNLPPGKYEIDVTKEGHSYWKKDVLILEKRVSEAYPFLILEPFATSSVSVELQPIVADLFMPATTTATTSPTNPFASISSTTSSSTKSLSQGTTFKNIYLYTEKNNLLALWRGETNATPFYFCDEETFLCDTTITATESKSPIKHFDFYPGRNDVVIYSNSDGVFVTELDTRNPQNFVTLAKGNVDFRLYNGHIYIKPSGATAKGIYELIYE